MAGYLLDTNILLRMLGPASAEKDQAVDAILKLRAAGHAICVTPQVLIEFWSVTTRPLNVNGFGWRPAVVSRELDGIVRQFTLLDDLPSVFGHWRELVESRAISGKRVHDVRLVAVMLAHSISHILTFNTTDFAGFSGIDIAHPATV